MRDHAVFFLPAKSFRLLPVLPFVEAYCNTRLYLFEEFIIPGNLRIHLVNRLSSDSHDAEALGNQPVEYFTLQQIL